MENFILSNKTTSRMSHQTTKIKLLAVVLDLIPRTQNKKFKHFQKLSPSLFFYQKKKDLVIVNLLIYRLW